jgi:inner membrane protein
MQSTFIINKTNSAGLAFKLWIMSAMVLSLGSFIGLSFLGSIEIFVPLVFFIGGFVGGIPAFVALLIVLPLIRRGPDSWKTKFSKLLIAECLIASAYGLIAMVVNMIVKEHDSAIQVFLFIWGVLSACALIATIICLRPACSYFLETGTEQLTYNRILHALIQNSHKSKLTMDTFKQESSTPSQSNRIMFKGVITGALILIMLVPTLLLMELVSEREKRQKEVVKEVSSRWAGTQTISGPYLVIPYSDSTTNNEGKIITVNKHLTILPKTLEVNGNIFPEKRQRSIYKVLLYKTELNISGAFKPEWPAGINLANLDTNNIKICFALSDYKGIEEEITINTGNRQILLGPGLPATALGTIGLSSLLDADMATLNAGISFSMKAKLKGSEQLHFMPMSANSQFNLKSAWPGPSFDGNSLPAERTVTDKGFSANWNFNRANLPFGTAILPGVNIGDDLAFGVTLVEPADQYDKTMRSIKYSILIIGLTFALFFIIELMQKKPFHPVQYVMVGISLVIFYTLLLSISEYIQFDYAYIIATAATVLLISFYAMSHFKNLKTAAIFFFVLSLLFGFILILIRLEDTALLIGSIGLFVVLALAMYASRKINWYGQAKTVA